MLGFLASQAFSFVFLCRQGRYVAPDIKQLFLWTQGLRRPAVCSIEQATQALLSSSGFANDREIIQPVFQARCACEANSVPRNHSIISLHIRVFPS
jgi:hypothetical protein